MSDVVTGTPDSASSAFVQDVELPLSYNALAIEQAGGPVIMQQKSIASLNDDEVLIRVSYASINSMDPNLARRNVFQLPEPYVLGFDFSGEVVRLGGGGTDAFKVGDQVFGTTPGRGGCFAEYVVAKREDIALRGAVPAPEASTFGIAYLTAYESLVLTANIQQHTGKWIYIAGAGGGLGHFAVQIAKMYGLKVIGSAGKPASLALLRELHLDRVVDYSKEDVIAKIICLTGGKGADLVYDSTYAQSSFTQSAAVVAAGGEYIRLGTDMQMKLTGAGDMRSVVEGRGATWIIADLARYSLDPRYKAQRSKVSDGMKQAVTWYEEGKLKPIITETVPFDTAALQQAFDAFVKGINNVGKVVIACNRHLDQLRATTV